MPKQEGQKSKLVTLLRILEQRTDENHRLNVPQLVQLLENQGILAERKSIYSDIDTLRSLGYDIQLQRGRGGGYWMASRAFELSELKLLVDAVQSSSVISARTSKRIIHKLEALCSDYEGTQLQRQVYVDGRPKTDSQTLLYSIDALHTAINRGCLVQFRYKGSSAVRTVSPWQLAWENGCYYLIAYQDEKAPPGASLPGGPDGRGAGTGRAAPGQGVLPHLRPARLPAQALQYVRRHRVPGHPAVHCRP